MIANVLPRFLMKHSVFAK